MSWIFVLLKLLLSGIAFILESIINFQFGKTQSGSDRGEREERPGNEYLVIHGLTV